MLPRLFRPDKITRYSSTPPHSSPIVVCPNRGNYSFSLQLGELDCRNRVHVIGVNKGKLSIEHTKSEWNHRDPFSSGLGILGMNYGRYHEAKSTATCAHITAGTMRQSPQLRVANRGPARLPYLECGCSAAGYSCGKSMCSATQRTFCHWSRCLTSTNTTGAYRKTNT